MERIAQLQRRATPDFAHGQGDREAEQRGEAAVQARDLRREAHQHVGHADENLSQHQSEGDGDANLVKIK